MSVELGGIRVATDPLLTRRLFHLRRPSPVPPPEAAHADVVLISHLHRDHLHLPSLRRFDPAVPVVVPRGTGSIFKGLGRQLVEVEPGDSLDLAGLHLEVLAAQHDGCRSHYEKSAAPALGFRFTDGTTSCWYPGDTGSRADFAHVGPVDLAAVPIGGWGTTLGDEHLDPEQAAAAVAAVGARWALAVHYGTFWPMTLRQLKPANHRLLFVTPPARFRQAMSDSGVEAEPLTPEHAVRLELA